MKAHSYGSAVEHESSLLNMENSVWLVIRHWDLERGLVLVGVKGLSHWINLLQPMFLQCVQKDRLGHLQTVVKIDKILILLGIVSSILRNSLQGSFKVVDRFDEILCKLLNSIVLRLLRLTLRPILEVSEVGNSAGEFVLNRIIISKVCDGGSNLHIPCSPLLLSSWFPTLS